MKMKSASNNYITLFEAIRRLEIGQIQKALNVSFWLNGENLSRAK